MNKICFQSSARRLRLFLALCEPLGPLHCAPTGALHPLQPVLPVLPPPLQLRRGVGRSGRGDLRPCQHGAPVGVARWPGCASSQPSFPVRCHVGRDLGGSVPPGEGGLSVFTGSLALCPAASHRPALCLLPIWTRSGKLFSVKSQTVNHATVP